MTRNEGCKESTNRLEWIFWRKRSILHAFEEELKWCISGYYFAALPGSHGKCMMHGHCRVYDVLPLWTLRLSVEAFLLVAL